MNRARWALVLALLILPALALACPTCKDALGENLEARGFGIGIYHTVVLLLGTFFSIVGFFIYKIVQEARRESVPGDKAQVPSA